jgi:NAD(P)-dependent dehydrogenase (short-subunit alcohol dehydrogenase family)
MNMKMPKKPRWVEQAGRQCLLLSGDLAHKAHCQALVDKTVERFGRIDILVNNAAFQMTHETFEEIPDDEWVMTFDVNITAIFRLCQAAIKHMRPGASIINTSSINSDMPKPTCSPTPPPKARLPTSPAVWRRYSGRKKSA